MFAEARDRLIDLGYAAGWTLVKATPNALSAPVFRIVADGATRRDGAGVRQLRKNLRRVVGPALPEAELEQLVGRALRSYARYWLETFRLPKLDKHDVAARTDANCVGAEHIDAALAAGTGAILALPHQGNWDAAGVWLIAHSGPFATVAERLDPESLFDRFVAYRESLGMEVIALTGGDRSPVSVLTERVKQNRVVCLLADRDLSGSGIEVEFFGEKTRMPGGPALLAATTGAALLPVSLWFTDDGAWGQRIYPPIAVPEGRLRERVQRMTQQLADAFADGIAAHPADWHMLQPLWPDDRPKSRGH